MIEWPDPIVATGDASADDLNLVTQSNLILEAAQELEGKNTALTTRVETLEEATGGVTKNLLIRQSRVSPNTDVLITADKLAMTSGLTLDDVDVQCDLGDAGAGGLDTGTVAASEWYYFFVIGDSTGVKDPDGFISTSTSPTLPTGYDVISDPLILLPTDSEGDLNAFMYDADSGIVRVVSNEPDTATGLLASVSLTSISETDWLDVSLAAFQPPGVNQVLVRFVGTSASQGDGAVSCVLWGKPTWAKDVSGGWQNDQRRLFELTLAVSGGAVISSDGASAPIWLELNDDGEYSFRESADDFSTLRACLVGYRFRP